MRHQVAVNASARAPRPVVQPSSTQGGSGSAPHVLKIGMVPQSGYMNQCCCAAIAANLLRGSTKHGNRGPLSSTEWEDGGQSLERMWSTPKNVAVIVLSVLAARCWSSQAAMEMVGFHGQATVPNQHEPVHHRGGAWSGVRRQDNSKAVSPQWWIRANHIGVGSENGLTYGQNSRGP